MAWYKKAAEQGSAEGLIRVGDCYTMGVGTARNFVEALAWYERTLAAKGSAALDFGIDWEWSELCIKLGDAHYHGRGTEQGFEAALTWYKKAEEGQHPDALTRVADCCYRGHGVERNFEKALSWYMRGALSGSSDVVSIAADCYEQGCGVQQNQIKARLLGRLAARKLQAEASGGDVPNEDGDVAEAMLVCKRVMEEGM